MYLARNRVQYTVYSAYVYYYYPFFSLSLSFGEKRDTAAVMELPEAGERELPHRARCLHKSVVKSKDKKIKRKNGNDIYRKK
jgi:hypothetical protein